MMITLWTVLGDVRDLYFYNNSCKYGLIITIKVAYIARYSAESNHRYVTAELTVVGITITQQYSAVQCSLQSAHSGFGEVFVSGSCGETHDRANCLPNVTDVPIARTTIPDSPSKSKN